MFTFSQTITSLTPEKRMFLYQVLVFIILSAGIILSGYLYYSSYEKEFRTGVEEQLISVGDLKANELIRWRNERLGDANLLYENPAFSTLVKRFHDNLDDQQSRTELYTWLFNIQIHYRYSRVFLLSPDGTILISAPKTPQPVSSHILQHLPGIISTGKIEFIDFYRDEWDDQIYLTILIPIMNGSSHNLTGIVGLQINPDDFLYPFISQWPTESETAETLLVRKEGESVLYLNKLRFRDDIALTYQLPLNQTHMPAVQAVLGKEGVFEGVDYRGIPVIAHIQKIPESPWYLVTRIDIAEVFESLTARAIEIIVIIIILLMVTGWGFYILHQREKNQFYLEQLKIKEALFKSEERLRLSLDAANDAIWDWNIPTGTAIFSPRWFTMLGYEPDEMPSAYDTWRSLLHPDDLNNAETQIMNSIQKNVGFTVEFRMKTKKGEWCWVLARGKIIEWDSDKNPIRMVGTHTDISDRKKFEEQITIQNQRLELSQVIGKIGSWEFDLHTGKIWGSNEGFHIYGMNPPPDNNLPIDEIESCIPERERIHQALIDLIEERSPYNLEFTIYPADGSQKRVIFSNAQVIKDESGNPLKVIGVIQDITSRKQAEIERDELIKRLSQNNEQLNAAYEELTSSEEELRYQYNALAAAEGRLREKTEFLDNLITYANVPIIIWDPQNVIIRVNHAFENLVGVIDDQLIGQSIRILFPPEQADHSMNLIETTKAGVRWDTLELPVLHQEGTIKTVLWNSSTLYSQDGETVVATIAQGQDMTQRKRLEEENSLALNQIQKNLAQLSILNDQIRNPLMVILLLSEIIEDEKSRTLIAEQIERIDDIVTHLDNRWMESEKVLTMIRKTYQIFASPQSVQMVEDIEERTRKDESSWDNDQLPGTSAAIIAEVIQAELYTILDSIDSYIFVADL